MVKSKKLKIFVVYADYGSSRVGTFSAYNEKQAIQRAIDSQRSLSSVFKNGGIELKNCTAEFLREVE